MKQILLKLHMPFSWWRTDGGKLQPTNPKLNAYLRALKQEIASLGEDLEDVELTAVHFDGGYMGLLQSDEFMDVLAAVHRAFPMAEDCEISGICFPGSLDMQMVSTYRNVKAGPLLLEVPSLLMRECEALKIPNVLQLLDHSRYLLEAYGQQNWGLIVPQIPLADGSFFVRSEGAWLHLAKELVRYQPSLILLEDGEQVCASAAFVGAGEFLRKAGYRPITPSCWTAAEKVPQFIAAREYAAVGLQAVTLLDGYRTENTGDWDRYLRCAADYRQLLVRVDEV